MKCIIFAALLPLICSLPHNFNGIRAATEDACRIVTTHTVCSGDTLTTISREYNSTVAAIVYVNPTITDPDFITPNQTIQIPASTCNDVAPVLINNATSTAICAAVGSETIYTVVAGATLTRIAKIHDITLKALIAANPQIKNPDVIEIEDQINIPICVNCVPKGTETTYTVVRGDTLTKIAGTHGITLDALVAANP